MIIGEPGLGLTGPLGAGEHLPLGDLRPSELEDQRVPQGVLRGTTAGLGASLLCLAKAQRYELPVTDVQDIVPGKTRNLASHGKKIIVELAAKKLQGCLVDGSVFRTVSADGDKHVFL
jgi:hypothetical protein